MKINRILLLILFSFYQVISMSQLISSVSDSTRENKYLLKLLESLQKTLLQYISSDTTQLVYLLFLIESMDW